MRLAARLPRPPANCNISHRPAQRNGLASRATLWQQPSVQTPDSCSNTLVGATPPLWATTPKHLALTATPWQACAATEIVWPRVRGLRPCREERLLPNAAQWHFWRSGPSWCSDPRCKPQLLATMHSAPSHFPAEHPTFRQFQSPLDRGLGVDNPKPEEVVDWVVRGWFHRIRARGRRLGAPRA